MKNILKICALFCYVTVTYSQNSNSDIHKIVTEHLKGFRTIVGQDAKVLIAFEYDVENAKLNQNDHVIQPSINLKRIKGNNNFFIKFLLMNNDGNIIIKAINFRISKLSRKHIEFTNMGNGNEYKL